MSEETKQDVFNDLVEQHQNYVITVIGDYGVNDKVIESWYERYDAALPDDLPVIPEAVGEYIRWCKGEGGIGNVSDAMGYAPTIIASWVHDECNSDVFARAWVLGVWRVEKTGKIVKLEAEKLTIKC